MRYVSCSWKDIITDESGSDLHFYRGTEGPATGFTLGHELLGEIVEVGKGIKRFKQGDLVIAPFSLSCGMSLSYHGGSWMLMFR
jgi:threonine dehydrogenase-like Zn-dependent dehydrogenase